MVEQLGRRAEVKSWTQRLEAEARSSPAMADDGDWAEPW